MDISIRPGVPVVLDGLADGLADEFEPGCEEQVWLNRFVPGRSLVDNCFSIARPLFGKPRAEWAMCLAADLVAHRPEAGRGKQKRGWAGGILLAGAIDGGLRADARVWLEVCHDVSELCGVRPATADRRLRQLAVEGLARPVHPPAYWDDIEPRGRVEDHLDLDGE